MEFLPWKNLADALFGIPVGAGVLAVWAVETRGDKGQVKRVIITLAVDVQGKRLVPWERHPEKLWHAPPSPNQNPEPNKKLALLRETLEPLLQRELEHRGLAKGSRGFEAKLIGWVEATL